MLNLILLTKIIVYLIIIAGLGYSAGVFCVYLSERKKEPEKISPSKEELREDNKAMIWGIIQFGVKWVAHTNTAVNVILPTFVEKVEANTSKIDKMESNLIKIDKKMDILIFASGLEAVDSDKLVYKRGGKIVRPK